MLVVNDQQYLAVILVLRDSAWWRHGTRHTAAADTGGTWRHRADGVRDGACRSSSVWQDAPRHVVDARQSREAGTGRQRLAAWQIHPVRVAVRRVVAILIQVIGAEVATKEVHTGTEILTKQRHRSSITQSVFRYCRVDDLHTHCRHTKKQNKHSSLNKLKYKFVNRKYYKL